MVTTSHTQLTSEVTPREVVRGMAIGVILMTFFAAYWAYAGTLFLGGSAQPLVFVLTSLVTVACFISAFLLIRASSRLPAGTMPVTQQRRLWGWFAFVFGLEIVLIALANIALPMLHHDTLVVPVIALIVGVHFLPLAALFQVPTYYVTGIAMALLGAIGLGALLLGIGIGGSDPYNWSRLVALGAALILWLTVLRIIVYGFSLARSR